MENYILIGDFVKLTKTTIKTVLYYHKIGLLKESKRSASGYRLYGADELARMRMINHLKNLGLDLKQIKEILGETQNNKSMKELLQSLHEELLMERKNLDAQISKVEKLLERESKELEETYFESKSFKMITDVLTSEQVKTYKESYPDLYIQQKNVFGVIDDFHWEKDYKNNFSKISEYFKINPDKYQIALEFGKRLAKLKQMDENDPEVENLAKEGAEFIINEPILKEMLYGKDGFEETNEKLFNKMTNEFLSPAQIKHKKLIQTYLNYRSKDNT